MLCGHETRVVGLDEQMGTHRQLGKGNVAAIDHLLFVLLFRVLQDGKDE
jgi:hypothetical protein